MPHLHFMDTVLTATYSIPVNASSFILNCAHSLCYVLRNDVEGFQNVPAGRGLLLLRVYNNIILILGSWLLYKISSYSPLDRVTVWLGTYERIRTTRQDFVANGIQLYTVAGTWCQS